MNCFDPTTWFLLHTELVTRKHQRRVGFMCQCCATWSSFCTKGPVCSTCCPVYRLSFSFSNTGRCPKTHRRPGLSGGHSSEMARGWWRRHGAIDPPATSPKFRTDQVRTHEWKGTLPLDHCTIILFLPQAMHETKKSIEKHHA